MCFVLCVQLGQWFDPDIPHPDCRAAPLGNSLLGSILIDT